jgi:aminopeptidase
LFAQGAFFLLEGGGVVQPDIVIENIATCIRHHTLFEGAQRIGFAHIPRYAAVSDALKSALKAKHPEKRFMSLSLGDDSAKEFERMIQESDLFHLFFDTELSRSSLKPPAVEACDTLLARSWRKSCVFKNYGDYFSDAFGTDPRTIASINSAMIEIANASKLMIYQDEFGSKLEIDIAGKAWTNLDGLSGIDILPGEIATLGEVNGTAQFFGTFFSQLPFALKYGVIKDSPIEIEIRRSEVVSFKTQNETFKRDFDAFLGARKSNRTVEEVGIGTNPTIVNLYGINSPFEERHMGLHLGLGGAEAGSNHLDLIFYGGSILFDQTLVMHERQLMFSYS